MLGPPQGPRNRAPPSGTTALRASELGAGGVALISPGRRWFEGVVRPRGWTTWRLGPTSRGPGYADPSSTGEAMVNRARDLGATRIIQYPGSKRSRRGPPRVGVRTESEDVDAPPSSVNCGGLWEIGSCARSASSGAITPTRNKMLLSFRPARRVRRATGGGRHGAGHLNCVPSTGDLTSTRASYDEVVDADRYKRGRRPRRAGATPRIARPAYR